MASKRQISANRQNAKQSTGPQTVAGKQRSSKNALKHGLARLSSDDEAQIQNLGVSIAGALGPESLMEEAVLLARAKLRLAEVRRVRDGMLAMLLDASADLNIKAIYSLDRYDRAAFTQHKRAIRSLCALEYLRSRSGFSRTGEKTTLVASTG
ncbi:hypothetical protein [Bradyrhizobium guangzhouense]|uniref:Uncharacterized protein n=1 Tax=Bradyrhizobium guangzhouense TaxID=1325095 RepID=A0AAE6CAF9_9BRAD|nr:hypothetical protein [Bradyrhizobium guangzhouense]QAU48731.1 hypothetical protein XH91_27505 [Bradyrhizobium guangzhouense]